MLRPRHLIYVLIAALSACGGGGNSSSLPATTPISPVTPITPSAAQSVQLSIRIPSATSAAAHTRRPAYVSSKTQSASISVNGGTAVVINLSTSAPGCVTATNGGRTCSTTVSAPVGNDTFVEKLFASNNGTGAPLAQGTTSAPILVGASNSVTLTLDGVPASVVVALANPTPSQNGSAQTIGLTVTIQDAAGAAIIGGDPFTAPITLTDSDTSGVTSLSTTSPLKSPTDAANLTVSYTGAALSSPAIFGATGSGITTVSTATLTPQPTGSKTAFNDYATFGYDNSRDVFNPNSINISPGNLSSLHLAWQATMGNYNTQTQPVLVTGIAGHAGLLIVGGGNAHMSAYDATTGKQVWDTLLPMGQLTYTCGSSGTLYFGVGGTVAYDRASQDFYVAGNSNPTTNSTGQTTLYKMSAATGTVISSVNFSPDPVGPSELDFTHTAVTLGANGLAYIGTGATCDISSWRGRIAAVDTSTMTLSNSFFPSWNPNAGQSWGGGGVWGWGGVSLDASGNVYSGFGNTDSGITTNGTIVAPFVASPTEYAGYGEAFAELSPGLNTVKQSNHPIPLGYYGKTPQADDLDINGTPILFNPNGAGCDPMAAIQGKAGALFVFDTAKIGSGPVASYQLAPTTYKDEFIGDPAYSPATGLIYATVPVGAGSLYPPGMIAIDPGCGSPSVTWHSQFGPDSDLNGNFASRSVPAVSAGGLVFVGTPCSADGNGGCTGNLTPTTSALRSTKALRRPLLCCSPPSNKVGGAVWVLNASTGEVLNGGLPLITTPGVIRVPPTIDGNWVFVLDNSGNIYGFTLDANSPSIQSTYRAVDSRSIYRWEEQPKQAMKQTN